MIHNLSSPFDEWSKFVCKFFLGRGYGGEYIKGTGSILRLSRLHENLEHDDLQNHLLFGQYMNIEQLSCAVLEF